jgi:hypothetical protein
MKLLDMSTEQRAELSARSGLAIDAKGQEVLQGLNAEESRFFAACMQQTPSKPAARERYAELMVRHEAARLRLASVDDESTGEEDGPPRLAHKF